MSKILTYTKKLLDPLDLDEEQIDIEDIAHALSMLCRANGHFKSFYSVAQHSINCMKEAKARGYSEKVQMACLLHDASEAYLSDMTRPVKAELPQYQKIETPLQEKIWKKWLGEPLTDEERQLVFGVDDDLLAHEFYYLLAELNDAPLKPLESQPVLDPAEVSHCADTFLRLFYQLKEGTFDFLTVGVDWMESCWIAVALQPNQVTYRRFLNIEEVCQAYCFADCIMVDAPIGLPENSEQAQCRPDHIARKEIPHRASTIFAVPCRQAVYAENDSLAKQENQHVLGKGLSCQSCGILGTILEVDQFLQRNPTWKNKLLESHPEVAFKILNGNQEVRSSKKDDTGFVDRCNILNQWVPDPRCYVKDFPRKHWNDFVDALCLALSAQLGCENGFYTLPEQPSYDNQGLKMQMVFGKRS